MYSDFLSFHFLPLLYYLQIIKVQSFEVRLDTSLQYCVALKQSLLLYFLYLMELAALALILTVFLCAQEVSGLEGRSNFLTGASR